MSRLMGANVLSFLIFGYCLSYNSTTEANPTVQTGNPVSPDIEFFSEISKRPLFHSTRRPKTASQNGVMGSMEDLRDQWRLSGIIAHEREPVALFVHRGTKANVRVTVGMPLDKQGVLSEIGSDYALIDDNGVSIRFELWEPREKTSVKPRGSVGNSKKTTPKTSPETGFQSGQAEAVNNEPRERKHEN